MKLAPESRDTDDDPSVITLPNVPYHIWVDGSFLDKDRNKAGAGALITRAEDEGTPVFAMAFNLSCLKIRDSKYTELWAAALALEEMAAFDVRKMTYDSPIIRHRIYGFRGDDEQSERVREERRDRPALYERLESALNQHPDMDIVHRKRNLEHMPVADTLSRVAAKRRLARIFSNAHDQDVPCLYKVMGRDRAARQSFFYDRMSEYDIRSFIQGRFQRHERSGEEATHSAILSPHSAE